MSIDAFDFDLPEEQIALCPAPQREQSKLLIPILNSDATTFDDRTFADILEYFEAGDVLILNDTRVFAARTHFRRTTGAMVELLWLYAADKKHWWAFGQTRKLRCGEKLCHTNNQQQACCVEVQKIDGDKVYAEVPEGFGNWLQHEAQLAIPPYIVKRRTQQNHTQEDTQRYQTVFGQKTGSIAAPTASLHWTKSLLQKLQAKGVQIVYITHHVGPGTFKPVRAQSIAEHKVDAEYCEIPEASRRILREALHKQQRITVCGTTACRAVEAVYAINRLQKPWQGHIDLTIRPGFSFAVTDRLITNFHLPKSSLLLLVAAFVGISWQDIYAHAVRAKYRFYSYGDAMLLNKQ